MKIVITNAYTWHNKGDAGILLATIDVLKKVYKDPEFSILSFAPDIDKIKYSSDKSIKEVESNILNPHPYKHTKFGRILAIGKLFFKMLQTQLGIKLFKKSTIKKNRNLELLDEADIIVVCGGGFLGGKKLDSLMHIYQIYVNTLFKKPVYVMGNSIEPIANKVVKKYTEGVLSRVDYIFAREKITEEYLKNILPDNKYCRIPDMAFSLEDKQYEFDYMNDLKKDNEIVIGITVRNWNFPNVKDKKKAKENYLKAVSDAMDIIIEKYKAVFVFVPQVIVEFGDDTETAKEIKKIMKNSNKFVIRNDDYSPYEIKAMASKCDYFIGTRMHSNIFATSMKIPTTAIAYEKKTNGIMETVNMSDYVVEIDTITKEELVSTIEKMIDNEEKIIKTLNERIPEIRKEIEEKTKKVLRERE